MNIGEIPTKGISCLIEGAMYTDEEREQYVKIISDFNKLYYKLGKQTWVATKWRGVNVFKAPTDIWIYQELINEIKPDLIIETGTCCGGSALFMRDVLDRVHPRGHIISIDIAPEKLEENAKVKGVTYYEGSSIDMETINFVKAAIYANNYKHVMIILDSDHSEEHVSKEIELYSPLVTVGSILIVEDTNNHPGPIAAVNKVFPREGWEQNLMCEKFMLTFNRDGYWERI